MNTNDAHLTAPGSYGTPEYDDEKLAQSMLGASTVTLSFLPESEIKQILAGCNGATNGLWKALAERCKHALEIAEARGGSDE